MFATEGLVWARQHLQDQWIKNNKENTSRKYTVYASQPARKPKDRWTDAVTKDAKIKTAGWKRVTHGETWGRKKKRLWPQIGTATLLETHSILTQLITREECTVSYPC